MPNKKKDAKSGNQNASCEKPNDVLQAVILADSFNWRFSPITLERPRVLLPLVNCTLLDYTVDFLLNSGVKEIYVFCSSHVDQIVNYLNDSKWKNNATAKFQTVLSEGCMSVGDALREIDRQAFIKTDFVLVHGDLVSNIKLDKILKEHKERRLKSKTSVMTMVYKCAAPGHKTRSIENDLFLATEPSSNRILHWEKSYGKKKFSLPLELFTDNMDVELRYNLLDCEISICSTEVLQLFTDNFDYQTKDDFVRGIIINEEVMGNKIHCFLVDEEYGARVSNIEIKDVIRRWVYPVVPDKKVLQSKNRYTYSRHNVYIGLDVVLARDCVLEQDVVVGPGSSVGKGSVVRRSVIGSNCVIGDNVVIEDSYIWNNVKINESCQISCCIICDNVTVKQNVVIEKGCILSFNVVVGPDIHLNARTKITLMSNDGKDDFGMSELSLKEKQDFSYDFTIIGSEGRGFLWKMDAESDEDEPELKDLWGCSSAGTSETSDESSLPGSPASTPPPDDAKLFYSEVFDTMRNGIVNQVSPDNLILEINASKYAYNVTFHELNHAVIKTFLESLFSGLISYQQHVLKDMKKAALHLTPLFVHYMKEMENQKIGILAAEEFFSQNEAMLPAFQTFLHLMYDKEIFDESVILTWFNSPVQSDDTVSKQIRKKAREQVSRFITWLEEAEEESDE
ncbi:translation initiation factor eIF-2B subunit epsilon-like isoform X2 [Xenia sp. Carnegie-2017]|uniref:translation initiation factor eIF-2B subunit epsilon-like isoform X2 n=1 Tax=Xenia sp. Carnegie-2017 TaxID=2897299 RepID=UPI001F045A39|nr:translation initiation factor eIF-2B subunit epsilon-like isoform X2 [Xenia sp. Carnegie-2017]